MKTWVWFIILTLVLLSITGVFAENKLAVQANAAILMNAETGEILYSKNQKAIMAPASTTKIMTAIIAIEKGNLDKKIKVSRHAASIPGSSMNLHRGEEQTLRDMLFGLMLPSGNDAATAIAEAIAGSEEKFAQLMNAKARKLGMKKTNYKNASGLPAVNHYTTAYDMAILAKYAIHNPTFAEIVQTKTASVPSSRSSASRVLTNHNKLLWQYPYTTGIKTGYTRRAGRCLVASATQSNVTLIAVVLKSNSMYNDSINLFDFGFQKIIVPTPEPIQESSVELNIEPTPGPTAVPIPDVF